MKSKITLLVILGIVILYLAYIFIPNNYELPVPDSVYDNLKVHIIDVGQGDATLLQGYDFTILIDAGRHDRNEVVPYLRSHNIKSIDLLIGTHPHADHIGQFPQVLQNFSVTEVWMSGDEHTTRTFERALDTILATNSIYREPRAGEVYNFGSASIKVLHPMKVTGSLNDGSLVVKITYGDIDFLFTGDAELNAEQEILQRGHDLQAHILKLGHHGSRSSTTESFLSAVNPDVAIYSAGIDNTYGHPHHEVINRLHRNEIRVFGTDLNGHILVTTDGTEYNIQVQRSRPISAANEPPKECVDINTTTSSELKKIVLISDQKRKN